MEIRSVPSIPANRPAATAAAAVATGYPAPASTASEGERSPGGFISPVVRYDQIARVAVLYFRDTDTGETKEQIPTERAVEEYRRNAVRFANGSGDSADRSGAAPRSGAERSDATASGFTPTPSGPAPSGDSAGFAPAPANSTGYTASPTPSGFSGTGASVSSGPSGGGAPGSLVSVTV